MSFPLLAVWCKILNLSSSGVCHTVARTADLTIALPTANPSAQFIDHDFCGFAFEETSFVEYATDADGNPNTFSQNLIQAVTSRTGGRPIIRLGGTSADFGRYEPGQSSPGLPVAEQNNYQDIGGTTIGPSYWALTKSFPDARYIIQVPLATTNISETIAWTQSAVGEIGWDKIEALEIGNEADLYINNMTGVDGEPLQPPEYQGKMDNATYVGNFTEYARALEAAVPFPPGPILEAFDASTHYGPAVDEEAYSLDVETCFNLGIDADTGGRIKQVAHHYYQGAAGNASTLATGLMNMTQTHHHLDEFKRQIDWLRENRPDIPFILSEVGNSLTPTHAYEYQARLGSALWQVDFYLYAMSIGVVRINYQQIMHTGYDMWLPVASAGVDAQVFANFYSQPFVADFIGTCPNTTMSQLNLTGGEAVPDLAAYGAFEFGDLKRIAVANLQYWNETSSGTERPSTSIDIAVPDGVTCITIERLSSPVGAGAGSDTITYAGRQWTFESDGKEVQGVRNDTSTVQVHGGVATVDIFASEAVLVLL